MVFGPKRLYDYRSEIRLFNVVFFVPVLISSMFPSLYYHSIYENMFALGN